MSPQKLTFLANEVDGGTNDASRDSDPVSKCLAMGDTAAALKFQELKDREASRRATFALVIALAICAVVVICFIVIVEKGGSTNVDFTLKGGFWGGWGGGLTGNHTAPAPTAR